MILQIKLILIYLLTIRCQYTTGPAGTTNTSQTSNRIATPIYAEQVSPILEGTTYQLISRPPFLLDYLIVSVKNVGSLFLLETSPPSDDATNSDSSTRNKITPDISLLITVTNSADTSVSTQTTCSFNVVSECRVRIPAHQRNSSIIYLSKPTTSQDYQYQPELYVTVSFGSFVDAIVSPDLNGIYSIRASELHQRTQQSTTSSGSSTNGQQQHKDKLVLTIDTHLTPNITVSLLENSNQSLQRSHRQLEVLFMDLHGHLLKDTSRLTGSEINITNKGKQIDDVDSQQFTVISTNRSTLSENHHFKLFTYSPSSSKNSQSDLQLQLQIQIPSAKIESQNEEGKERNSYDSDRFVMIVIRYSLFSPMSTARLIAMNNQAQLIFFSNLNEKQYFQITHSQNVSYSLSTTTPRRRNWQSQLTILDASIDAVQVNVYAALDESLLTSFQWIRADNNTQALAAAIPQQIGIGDFFQASQSLRIRFTTINRIEEKGDEGTDERKLNENNDNDSGSKQEQESIYFHAIEAKLELIELYSFTGGSQDIDGKNAGKGNNENSELESGVLSSFDYMVIGALILAALVVCWIVIRKCIRCFWGNQGAVKLEEEEVEGVDVEANAERSQKQQEQQQYDLDSERIKLQKQLSLRKMDSFKHENQINEEEEDIDFEFEDGGVPRRKAESKQLRKRQHENLNEDFNNVFSGQYDEEAEEVEMQKIQAEYFMQFNGGNGQDQLKLNQGESQIGSVGGASSGGMKQMSTKSSTTASKASEANNLRNRIGSGESENNHEEKKKQQFSQYGQQLHEIDAEDVVELEQNRSCNDSKQKQLQYRRNSVNKKHKDEDDREAESDFSSYNACHSNLSTNRMFPLNSIGIDVSNNNLQSSDKMTLNNQSEDKSAKKFTLPRRNRKTHLQIHIEDSSYDPAPPKPQPKSPQQQQQQQQQNQQVKKDLSKSKNEERKSTKSTKSNSQAAATQAKQK